MKLLLALFVLLVDVSMAVAIISFSPIGAFVGAAVLLTLAWYLFGVAEMVSRWTNIHCRALGCCCGEYPYCVRCSADIYDIDYIDTGDSWMWWWYALMSIWRTNKRFVVHRCDECNKFMLFSREECCSSKCYETWIPF